MPPSNSSAYPYTIQHTSKQQTANLGKDIYYTPFHYDIDFMSAPAPAGL